MRDVASIAAIVLGIVVINISLYLILSHSGFLTLLGAQLLWAGTVSLSLKYNW